MADVPEHIVAVPAGVILAGNGFTVTSEVKVEPAQLFAVGVTVYLSTPPVTLVNGCAMVVPQEEAQLEAPETEPDNNAAVHIYVVPFTVELNATLLAVPLHKD